MDYILDCYNFNQDSRYRDAGFTILVTLSLFMNGGCACVRVHLMCVHGEVSLWSFVSLAAAWFMSLVCFWGGWSAPASSCCWFLRLCGVAGGVWVCVLEEMDLAPGRRKKRGEQLSYMDEGRCEERAGSNSHPCTRYAVVGESRQKHKTRQAKKKKKQVRTKKLIAESNTSSLCY